MVGCLGSARRHEGSKVMCLDLTQIKRESVKEQEKSFLSVGRKKRKLHCEFVG